MSKPHKVKVVATNSSIYAMLAVCEYCGKTAFYGNNSEKQTDPTRDLGDCPNSPDYLAVVGTEFLSLLGRIGNPSNGRTEQQ